ncbi:MAG: sodium:proton antiporter NhaD [Saprospiraceae bacterium]|jgi:Na+/H+ antiporter NhaD/arsenite permease-like protein|nr:sodium:proton antiporter NhaD [Saprospiraceae bacterium]MBP6448525.1 sodium:proton antiporter NhaD [Saprospiraceae bacterium]
MIAAVILIFVIGYLMIVFEHPLKLDKTVPALLMGSLMWAVVAVGFYSGNMSIVDGHDHVFSMAGLTDPLALETNEEGFVATLIHHIGKIAEILVFLIGAMTIVELIDLHRGFDVIKDWITTKNKIKLLWITGIIAFLLSSIIDNLTTTIVLISLLRKLVPDRNERLWYVCLIITAANAGGAWSPIGDVTTTMLWIGKKVTSIQLMEYIVLPAIVCFIVPYFLVSFKSIFKGDLDEGENKNVFNKKLLSSNTMLFLGLAMIIFVPIFKTLTHLPPYIGMMLSLGVVWAVSEYIHPEENFDESERHKYSPHKALSRIELSSILFFLGILLAIAAFETAVISDVSILRSGAEALSHSIPNINVVLIILGFVSAVIDNVPLVAAGMGMYDNPLDDQLWHFMAYTAGTGGSMLIIGSAAGVAAMGMEKIDFIWYLKNISWVTAAGYLAGCAVFLLLA